MKIGFFDSGLGGLLIARAASKHLPQYDTMYLGDTLRVPYGKRSKEFIYEFSLKAVDWLFRNDCNLIITACNTVSVAALRRLQQEYLPEHYPDRRILGVVVPTLEEAIASGHKRIGVIATDYTIRSRVYEEELGNIDPDIAIIQNQAPLLVPLIEHDGLQWADPILKHYLEPIQEQNADCLILGCTHYTRIKDKIKDICGDDFTILSQDEIIPLKLKDYLDRHPEIETKLSKSSTHNYYVTDLTDGYQQMAQIIFGESISLQKVVL